MLYLLPIAHFQPSLLVTKSQEHAFPLLPYTAAVHAFMQSTSLHLAVPVSADAFLAQQTMASQGPPIGWLELLQF